MNRSCPLCKTSVTVNPSIEAHPSAETKGLCGMSGLRYSTARQYINNINQQHREENDMPSLVKTEFTYKADYSDYDGEVPSALRRKTSDLTKVKTAVAEFESAEFLRGWSGKWSGLNYIVSNNRGTEQYRIRVVKTAVTGPEAKPVKQTHGSIKKKAAAAKPTRKVTTAKVTSKKAPKRSLVKKGK